LLEQLNAQVEVLQQTEDYAKFQVDPLERGFGLTLGNALRRVLLSSMPGAAVTAVRIERIYHEFATIPGVKEDTTELLLNLKQLRLKSHSDQPVTLRLEAQGPGVVTARPSTRISPRVGITRPSTIRSSVVFPQPEAPTIEMNCPASTWREMLRRASNRRPRRL